MSTAKAADPSEPEYDYIVIGSGFGGSVSALRLAQKGYRVAVVEAGRRWAPGDYPKSNWNVRRFLWAPKLRCFGIQRVDLLDDVVILSGAGVGGGSLVYANTLYVPPEPFFAHETVQRLGGRDGLMPYYRLAERMLGVVENPVLGEVDDHLRETAETFGRGHTFGPTSVGIYFGEGPGEQAEDPFFGGEGPDRVGCTKCANCMVGCRYNAKNTLDRNYLYLAEKLGAEILAETTVTDIEAVGARGGDGYRIHTKSSTGLLGAPRKVLRTKGVVLSAGVLGTMRLLMSAKERGRLPEISDQLGRSARTNSESIIAVSLKDRTVDLGEGIAISSSVHPDEHTHIEPVRYQKGSDAMGLLAAPALVDGGGGTPRQLRFLGAALRHPLRTVRMLVPLGFAKRTIILLVMQDVDSSLRLRRGRRWWWPFKKTLRSAPEGGESIPTYIPIANEFARRLAKQLDGTARSTLNEALLDVPTTAHILGGACIGETAEEGVIDLHNRVHGYENLLVCDGSMIPANLGVNPSLSITAFAERAMAAVPCKAGATAHHFGFESDWGVVEILDDLPHSGGVQ